MGDDPSAGDVHEAASAVPLRGDGDGVASGVVRFGRIRHHERAAADVEVIVRRGVAGNHERSRHVSHAGVFVERKGHALVDECAPVCVLAQASALLQRQRRTLSRTELAPEINVEGAVLPRDVAAEGGICHEAVHVAAEVKRAAALG